MSQQGQEMQLAMLQQQNRKRPFMSHQTDDQTRQVGSKSGPRLIAGGSPEAADSRETDEREEQRGFHMTAGSNKRFELEHSVADADDGTTNTASSSRDIIAQMTHTLLKQLGIPKQFTTDLKSAEAYVSDLRKHSTARSKPKATKPLIIHRVGKGEIYLDEPRWMEGEDDSSGFLAGKAPISDVRAYVSRHTEVAFIVCRDYGKGSPNIDGGNKDENGNVNVHHHAENIIPAERSLALALRKLNAFTDRGFPSNFEAHNVEYDDIQEFSNDWLYGVNDITLSYPYLSFYHGQTNSLEGLFEGMEISERVQFKQLATYIVDTYKQEYDEVETLTRKGRITNAYLAYLFRPGIVVVVGKGEDARGYMCDSWLEDDGVSETDGKKCNYAVRAWNWDTGQRFTRNVSTLRLSDISPSEKSETEIDELELRPLNFVTPETRERLQRRGEWAWKCRYRQIVAYRGTSTETFHRATGERYIVDMDTYHKLHSNRAMFESKGPKTHGTHIDSTALAQKFPPDDAFIYITEAFTRGFNLKTKKWCDLCIDRFEEVEWNTSAFRSLVLPEKTKRLIQALVSNQIEAEMSTDIISGKGNGLIMLLHGGPGTGKTLTAESVAEIAQKPLYPVTCGDMGTDPRDVEKYLESVLHLGKTWGCVVLLDEADVFLEQRSLEDLKRNALVSVFLRVLEYYDGILILTSNRVGTFDEAFKSRIQLAIHYTSLTEHQRTKVWGNFISRLKQHNEEGIDFADLEDNIENLAKHKMNGREIRNVITTSRQYARWERKQQSANQNYLLNYRLVEEVIETSGQFDKYIAKLNGGLTHDQLAQDEGWRLANGG